jgi:unsaturated rhamnogalacturonyl hydrolase
MFALISVRRLSILCFAAGAFFVMDSAAQAPSDSVVLASAKKYGRIMCNWFLKKNATMATDYPTSCSFYGICIFSEAIKDTSFLNAVSQRYKTYMAGSKYPPPVGSVDMNIHGIVPFELYRQTKDAQFLPVGTRIADDEFSTAHLRSDSLSTYSRFWVDDMYMIGSLQTQAYKSTNSAVYINNGARTLWRYGDSLQQPNGLYYHSYYNHALFYWGRGNGWAASSMSELLSVIPAIHPRYAAIMASYLNQMRALYKYQDTSGMWHQLIDDKVTFLESSCTGMFTFGLATGLDHGWLEGDSFKVAAKKGWTALVNNFDTVNGLKNVCIGLNASADSANYTQHTIQTGDSHGTAGFLWAATAMVRLLGKSGVQIVLPEKGRVSIKNNIHVNNNAITPQGRLIHKNGRINTGAYIDKGKFLVIIP